MLSVCSLLRIPWSHTDPLIRSEFSLFRSPFPQKKRPSCVVSRFLFSLSAKKKTITCYFGTPSITTWTSFWSGQIMTQMVRCLQALLCAASGVHCSKESKPFISCRILRRTYEHRTCVVVVLRASWVRATPPPDVIYIYIYIYIYIHEREPKENPKKKREIPSINLARFEISF